MQIYPPIILEFPSELSYDERKNNILFSLKKKKDISRCWMTAKFLSCPSLYRRLLIVSKFTGDCITRKKISREKTADAGNAFLKNPENASYLGNLSARSQPVASWNSRFNRMRTAVPVIFLPFFFYVIYRYNVRVTIKQYANGIEDFSFGGGCLCLARSVHSRRGIPFSSKTLRSFTYLYRIFSLTLSRAPLSRSLLLD